MPLSFKTLGKATQLLIELILSHNFQIKSILSLKVLFIKDKFELIFKAETNKIMTLKLSIVRASTSMIWLRSL